MCVLNKTIEQSTEFASTTILGRLLPRCFLESIASVIGWLLRWSRGESQKKYGCQLKKKQKCSTGISKYHSTFTPRALAHWKNQRLKCKSVKEKVEKRPKAKAVLAPVKARKTKMKSCDSTATLNDVPEMCRSEIAVAASRMSNTRLGNLRRHDPGNIRNNESAQSLARRASLCRVPHPEKIKSPTFQTDAQCKQNTTVKHAQPKSMTPVKPTARKAKKPEHWIYNQPTNPSTDDLTSVSKINFENTQSITSILMEKAKKTTCIDPGFMSYSPYTPPVRYINIGKKHTIPVTRNLLDSSRIPGDSVDGASADRPRTPPQETGLLQSDLELCSNLITTAVDDATTDLICGDMQLIVNKYSLAHSSQKISTLDRAEKESPHKQLEYVDFCQGDSAKIRKKTHERIPPRDIACVSTDSQTRSSGLHKEITYSQTTASDDYADRDTFKYPPDDRKDFALKCPLDFQKKNKVHFSVGRRICDNRSEDSVRKTEESQDSATQSIDTSELALSNKITGNGTKSINTDKYNNKRTTSSKRAPKLSRLNMDKMSQRSDRFMKRPERSTLPPKLQRNLEAHGMHEILETENTLPDKTGKLPQKLQALSHFPQEVPPNLQQLPQKCDNSLTASPGKKNSKRNDPMHRSLTALRNSRKRSHQPIIQSIATSLLHSIKNAGKFKAFYETTEAIPRNIIGPIRGKSFVNKFRPYHVPLWRRGIHKGAQITKSKYPFTSRNMTGAYMASNRKYAMMKSLPPCGHKCGDHASRTLKNEATSKQSTDARMSYKTCDAVAFLNLFLHMPKFIHKRKVKDAAILPGQSSDQSEKGGNKSTKSWSSTDGCLDEEDLCSKQDPNLLREENYEICVPPGREMSNLRVTSEASSNLGTVLSRSAREKSSLEKSQPADSLTHGMTKETLSNRFGTNKMRASQRKLNLKTKQFNDTFSRDPSKKQMQMWGSINSQPCHTLTDSSFDIEHINASKPFQSKHSTLENIAPIPSQRDETVPCFENRQHKNTSTARRRSRLPIYVAGATLKQSSQHEKKQPQRVFGLGTRLQPSKIPVFKNKILNAHLGEPIYLGQCAGKRNKQSAVVNTDGGVSAGSDSATPLRFNYPLPDDNQNLVLDNLTLKEKLQFPANALLNPGTSESLRLPADDNSVGMKRASEKTGACFPQQISSITLSKASTLPKSVHNFGSQLKLRKERQTGIDYLLDALGENVSSSTTVPSRESTHRRLAKYPELQRQSSIFSETVYSQRKALQSKMQTVTAATSSITQELIPNDNEHPQPRIELKPCPGRSVSACRLKRKLIPQRVDIVSRMTDRQQNERGTIINTQSIRDNRRKGIKKLENLMQTSGFSKFNSLSEDTILPSVEQWNQKKARIQRRMLSERSIASLVDSERDRQEKNTGLQTGKNRVRGTDWMFQVIKESQLTPHIDTPRGSVDDFKKMMILNKSRRTLNRNKIGYRTYASSSNQDNFSRTGSGSITPEREVKTYDNMRTTQDRKMDASAIVKVKNEASFTKRNMTQNVKTKLSSAAVKWFCNVCEGLSQSEIFTKLANGATDDANRLWRSSEMKKESITTIDQITASGSCRLLSGTQDNYQDSSMLSEVPDFESESNSKRFALKMPVEISSSENAQVKSETAVSKNEITDPHSANNFKINLQVDRSHSNTTTCDASLEKMYHTDNTQSRAYRRNLSYEKPPQSKDYMSGREKLSDTQIIARNRQIRDSSLIRSSQKSASNDETKQLRVQCNIVTASTKSTREIHTGLKGQKANMSSGRLTSGLVGDLLLLEGKHLIHKKLCFKDVEKKHSNPTFVPSLVRLPAHKQAQRFSRTDSLEEHKPKTKPDVGDAILKTKPETGEAILKTKNKENVLRKTQSTNLAGHRSRLLTKSVEKNGRSMKQQVPSSKALKHSNVLQNRIQMQSFPKYTRYAVSSENKLSFRKSASNSQASQENLIRKYSLASIGTSVSGTITDRVAALANYKDLEHSLSLTESSCHSRQQKSVRSNTPTLVVSYSPPNDQLTSPTTLFTEVDCPEETSCRRTKLVKTVIEDLPGPLAAKKGTSHADNEKTKTCVSRINQTSECTFPDKHSENISILDKHSKNISISDKHSEKMSIVRSKREGKQPEIVTKEEQTQSSTFTQQVQAETRKTTLKDPDSDHVKPPENVSRNDATSLIKNDQPTSQNEDLKQQETRVLDKTSSKQKIVKPPEDKCLESSEAKEKEEFPGNKLSLLKDPSDLLMTASIKKVRHKSCRHAKKLSDVSSITSEQSLGRRLGVSNYDSTSTDLDECKGHSLETTGNELSTLNYGMVDKEHGALNKIINNNLPELKKPLLLQQQQILPSKQMKTISEDDQPKHPAIEITHSNDILGEEKVKVTDVLPDVAAVKCLPQIKCLSELRCLSKMTSKTSDTVDRRKLIRVSESAGRKSKRGGLMRYSVDSSLDSGTTGHTDRGCVSMGDTMPRVNWEQYSLHKNIDTPNLSGRKQSEPGLNVKIKSSDKDSRDTSQISVDTTNVFTEMCLRSSVWNNTFSALSETLDEETSIKSQSHNPQHSPHSFTKEEPKVLKLDGFGREFKRTDFPKENAILDSTVDFPQRTPVRGKEHENRKPKPDLRQEVKLSSRDIVITDGELEIPELFKGLNSDGKVAAKRRIFKQNSCHILKRGCHIPDQESIKILQGECCTKNLHSETSVHKGKHYLINERNVETARSETVTPRGSASVTRHSARDLLIPTQKEANMSSNLLKAQPESKDLSHGLVEEAEKPVGLNKREHALSRQGGAKRLKKVDFSPKNKSLSHHYLECSKIVSLRPVTSFLDHKSSLISPFQRCNSKPSSKELPAVSFNSGSNFCQRNDTYFKSPSLSMAALVSYSGTDAKSSSSRLLNCENRGKHIRRIDTIRQDEHSEQIHKRYLKSNRTEKDSEASRQPFSRPLFWDWRDTKCRDLLTSIRSKAATRGHAKRMVLTDKSFKDFASSPLLKLAQHNLDASQDPQHKLSLSLETKHDSSRHNQCQVAIDLPGVDPNLPLSGTFRESVDSCSTNNSFQEHVKLAYSDRTPRKTTEPHLQSDSCKIIWPASSNECPWRHNIPSRRFGSVDNQKNSLANISNSKENSRRCPNMFRHSIERPVGTKQHIKTERPEETGQHEETEHPEETGQHEETEHPEETGQHEETGHPEETGQHEETGHPEETGQHEEIEQSEEAAQIYPNLRPQPDSSCLDSLSQRTHFRYEESKTQKWSRDSPGSLAHSEECPRNARAKVPPLAAETFVGKIVYMFETKASTMTSKRPSQTDC